MYTEVVTSMGCRDRNKKNFVHHSKAWHLRTGHLEGKKLSTLGCQSSLKLRN